MDKTTLTVLGTLALILVAVGNVSAGGCPDAAAEKDRVEGSGSTVQADFSLSANYTGSGCARTSLSFTSDDGTEVDTDVLCVATIGYVAQVVATVTSPAEMEGKRVLMKVVDYGSASVNGKPDEVGITMLDPVDPLAPPDCVADEFDTMATLPLSQGNVTVQKKK